jgi:hypothetical protein
VKEPSQRELVGVDNGVDLASVSGELMRRPHARELDNLGFGSSAGHGGAP